MPKAKLHEILAVEGDLEGEYKKILDEALVVFKKGEHFVGHVKTLTMFDDARKHEETAAKEVRALTTTVPQKLSYIAGAIKKYFDVVAQKEATNQRAVANVEIDGKVFLENLPATFLLGLETKLKKVRDVYEAMPTLAPGIKWELAPQEGNGIYTNSEPETAMKTEKTIKPMVLYEATKEHPAQVRELADNVNVGVYRKQYFVGLLSPAEKSDYLSRIDILLRAVKKARQRANTQEVVDVNVGKKIMDFINGK
jgi:hypothetical protein